MNINTNTAANTETDYHLSSMAVLAQNKEWRTICHQQDLIKNSGVSALVTNEHGQDEQIAIFHLPTTKQQVYAVSNYDPIGGANVLYRGIVGSIGDEPVIASPLYKQHFSLHTGACFQSEEKISVYQIRIEDQQVQLFY